MNKIFAVLFPLFYLSVPAIAQTAPIPAKLDAKIEKEAVELLRETTAEVGRLRTAENRISFNAELAGLMWFHDEKEARIMYGSVINDFQQLLSQFDMQMNSLNAPPDEGADMMGGIFGNYGQSKVERKFRIAMAVRKQIAMSMAEHTPDLAFNFFYDSRNLILSPQFRKETEQSDKYFEGQLLKTIAENDAAKAVEYGKESIKDGIDSSHVELLKKIYAKDADKGIEFGGAILSRLKGDKSSIQNIYVYSSLLSYGSENLEASKKPDAKKPVYDSSDLHVIADQYGQMVLDAEGSSGFAYGSSLQQIEKYAPARAAQIRAKQKSLYGEGTNSMRPANAVAYAMANAANAMANAAMPTNSNSAAQQENRALEERAKNEKQIMDDIKDLGSKPLPKEERDKVIAKARKVISQTPGKDKKLIALSQLAAQVAHLGDKELAAEIMRDATRLVNPQPKNYQDFLLTWMLASGYAEADPDEAFPLLESTIFRANETIAAAVRIAEFIDVNDEYVVDGEVQVGAFGGELIRGLTGEIGMANSTLKLLATADFAKTQSLTNTFDRTETRVLAKMLVLRAVLDNRDTSKKALDLVKSVNNGEDSEPPSSRLR